MHAWPLSFSAFDSTSKTIHQFSPLEKNKPFQCLARSFYRIKSTLLILHLDLVLIAQPE